MLCRPQAVSMATSERASLVLRSTSLTIRQRFTPASACSTRTRMRASLRLVRFWAGVSSPPGGFFFRLARPGHERFVPLEAAVLVQDRARRIGDAFAVRDPFVGPAPGVGRAEVLDAAVVGRGDYHVLVAVGLLAAAVVRRLFFRVFGPLATSLAAVDDAPHRPSARLPRSSEGPGVALR